MCIRDRLYTDPDHPLQRQPCVEPHLLRSYPSPALQLDPDSVYAQICSDMQLWNHPLHDKYLEPASWERLVSDQMTVIPSTPRAVAFAKVQAPALRIQPLKFQTGYSDQDLLIFPRTIARELRLQDLIRAVHSAYQLTVKCSR